MLRRQGGRHTRFILLRRLRRTTRLSTAPKRIRLQPHRLRFRPSVLVDEHGGGPSRYAMSASERETGGRGASRLQPLAFRPVLCIFVIPRPVRLLLYALGHRAHVLRPVRSARSLRVNAERSSRTSHFRATSFSISDTYESTRLGRLEAKDRGRVANPARQRLRGEFRELVFLFELEEHVVDAIKFGDAAVACEQSANERRASVGKVLSASEFTASRSAAKKRRGSVRAHLERTVGRKWLQDAGPARTGGSGRT
jgi:hypothetical protein